MSWLISALIASLVLSSTNRFIGETPLFVTTPTSACTVAAKTQTGDETERIDKTFPLSPDGKVSVSNVNGSIVIEAWDRNEVKFEAVKTADSRERLSQMDIRIESKPDSLTIDTEYGRRNGGNWNCYGTCKLNVEYKLTVPKTASLKSIETVNGSVTISNMTNYTSASAVNGSVKATNLRGTAYIETVNGTTEATFENLNDDSKINLTTVNGQVILTIPSDSDATVKAESVNGRISNDFGLVVRKGKYVGRDLYGKVGDGRAKINLESVNGGLTVKRRQDGKAVKPITNLLPATDDEDAEDIVVAVEVDADQIRKSVTQSTRVAVAESLKVAKDAPRIAAEAMKDAEKEMAKAEKEMAKSERDMRRTEQSMARASRDFELMNSGNWENSARAWNEFTTPSVDEKSQSFSVEGVPNITVNSKNCPVSVRGWDKDEVQYRVITVGNSAMKPDVSVSASQSNSSIVINTAVKAKKIKNLSGRYSGTMNVGKDGEISVIPKDAVRMEIFVPKESNLKIKTDKEIRVEGVSGKLDLDGDDGAINVRNSSGKLSIAATDAMIRVIGFEGEIDSRAGDGTNIFEGDFTKLSAEAEDGKIVLTLPEDIDADIEANTEIQTDGFEIPVEAKTENTCRLGSGGTKFKLKVGDGQVFVRSAKTIVAK